MAVNPADFPPLGQLVGTAGSSTRADANSAGEQATSDSDSAGSAGRPTVGATILAPNTADNCGTPLASSYVAELYDVSEWLAKEAGPPENPFGDFLVQSSAATSCGRTVVFGRVVPNRKYLARIHVYADTDGDPKTIDVCTIHGTSVTFVRNPSEDCATTLAQGSPTLAQPIRTLTCYGWQVEASLGDAGTAAIPNINAAIAIQYRTVALHFCTD